MFDLIFVFVVLVYWDDLLFIFVLYFGFIFILEFGIIEGLDVYGVDFNLFNVFFSFLCLVFIMLRLV